MAPPTSSVEDTSYDDTSLADERGEESAPPPHGVVCVREVLRFLVSITDPRDGGNSSRLMATGLGLVHVALETGCQQMSKSLMSIVGSKLCRHLIMVGYTWCVFLALLFLRYCIMIILTYSLLL